MPRSLDNASRWMYQGLWSVLVGWFRVPAEPPSLPAAHADESVVSFHPAPGYLKYLKFWFWIVLAITDIALAVGYLIAAIALIIEGLWWVALLIGPPTLFLIVAPDIVAYIAIHLKYDTMWYAMTDRSLRIRRGIWVIHEVTITFENVQNLSVQSGPIQRHFGIANLVVETAGAGSNPHQKGGGSSITNKGVVEGIADAAGLRDKIMARMRQSRGAGLGDDAMVDPIVETAMARWSAAHIDALRSIRDEVRALGAAPGG